MDFFFKDSGLIFQAMVVHGRVELLAHPLSQKYLEMKWHSYGKYFHLVNLLFYCIFLTFVTLFAYLLMEYVDLHNAGRHVMAASKPPVNDTEEQSDHRGEYKKHFKNYHNKINLKPTIIRSEPETTVVLMIREWDKRPTKRRAKI